MKEGNKEVTRDQTRRGVTETLRLMKREGKWSLPSDVSTQEEHPIRSQQGGPRGGERPGGRVSAVWGWPGAEVAGVRPEEARARVPLDLGTMVGKLGFGGLVYDREVNFGSGQVELGVTLIRPG